MRGEVSLVARAAPVAGADFGRGGGSAHARRGCGAGVPFGAVFVGSPHVPQRCPGPGGERGTGTPGRDRLPLASAFCWPPEALQHLAGPFPEGPEAFLSGPGAVPLCGAVGERLGGQKCVRKAGKRWRLEIWQVFVLPGASCVMG